MPVVKIGIAGSSLSESQRLDIQFLIAYMKKENRPTLEWIESLLLERDTDSSSDDLCSPLSLSEAIGCHRRLIVACDSKKIIGFCTLVGVVLGDETEGRVEYLVVDDTSSMADSLEGRLLERAFRVGKELGFSRVLVSSSVANFNYLHSIGLRPQNAVYFVCELPK